MFANAFGVFGRVARHTRAERPIRLDVLCDAVGAEEDAELGAEAVAGVAPELVAQA